MFNYFHKCRIIIIFEASDDNLIPRPKHFEPFVQGLLL